MRKTVNLRIFFFSLYFLTFSHLVGYENDYRSDKIIDFKRMNMGVSAAQAQIVSLEAEPLTANSENETAPHEKLTGDEPKPIPREIGILTEEEAGSIPGNRCSFCDQVFCTRDCPYWKKLERETSHSPNLRSPQLNKTVSNTRKFSFNTNRRRMIHH